MSYSYPLPRARRDALASRLGDAAFSVWDSLLRSGMRLVRLLQTRRPWLAAQLRRVLLVLWWAATLQLPTQFRYWRHARAARRAAPQPVALHLIEAAQAETIVVPCAASPVVSVIIPTYGQIGFTLRCLASIAAYPPRSEIEVIVVDDGFPGTEAACLARVRGIKLHRNETNLGFLRACNAAAVSARGEFLLFLNNDTQVLPDWTDAMLTLFRTRPDTGAVGSKLLYPDGTLQEAGGIIWSDGSGWNFGRGTRLPLPAHNYVREVDYCSAASLMVRRDVFCDLGGFDTHFAPAYYEDTDLCFRLRAIGLKTLYQPCSTVVHYEGVSHGRDPAAGIKACQTLNRRRFVRRWKDVLARDHYTNNQHVLRAKEHARHRQVALVVDHQVPEPDRDAGSYAILCVIEALLDTGMVVKFWPHNLQYKAGYVEALQQRGIEVLHGPHQAVFATWMQENGMDLDLVLLSRPDVADDCLATVRANTAARVVYYGHDLHFSRMRQQGAAHRDECLLRAADRMEDIERRVWRASDAVLYLSEDEADAVRALEPAAISRAVVPYCFDTFASERLPIANRHILFVAGFGHPPNADAASWFVEAVLPLVQARVPNAELSIVGSHPNAQVRALAGDAVKVVADVSGDELSRHYREARVAVVPLRCGAGVKLKVVEALREGVPLVTTPIGAQGLPGLDNAVSVRADAAEFAAAVCELLTDDTLWVQRSAAQIAYARGRFNRDAFNVSLLAALEGRVQSAATLAA